jgi:hypothetical protein
VAVVPPGRLQRPPEVATIECVSIIETAADKFVALARRAGAELAGLVATPDPTLVRHLHDLHALRAHYDPAEVPALAREIMVADAAAYGNQFPAYWEDPMRETLRAGEGLAAEAGYSRQYRGFQRLMVYAVRLLSNGIGVPCTPVKTPPQSHSVMHSGCPSTLGIGAEPR